jgi:uncharacterized protein YxjI
MKLFIKQRVFAFGQKFDIYDETGETRFYCEGEIFTFGRKLHLYNTAGQEVVYIKQKLLSLLPKYEIYINGSYTATLIKKFTILSHDYYYQDLDWNVSGEFLAHEYMITSSKGNTIMTLSKRWLTWGDTYCLDIFDNKNLLLCLASSIVIDSVCHED